MPRQPAAKPDNLEQYNHSIKPPRATASDASAATANDNRVLVTWDDKI